MKNRKNLILLVSLATLLTIFLPMQVKATTEEEYPYAYVYMQKGTLNVRAEPSTSATITEKLHIGDVVEKRTITKDGWSKVITLCWSCNIKKQCKSWLQYCKSSRRNRWTDIKARRKIWLVWCSRRRQQRERL